MPEFTCRSCGDRFELPSHILDRYPGWTPAACRSCRDATSTPSRRAPSRRSSAAPSNRRPTTRRGGAKRRGSGAAALLSPEDVLARYPEGRRDGVFTDGGAVGNPGPGGWGAVYVVDGEIAAEAAGHEPDTTNNRMELTAIIEGAELVPEGTDVTIYSDSNYAVRSLTEWAPGWERRGWRRKSGPVENLDLVQTAYHMLRRRPELALVWVPAHTGERWNEYADALANRWRLER